MSMQVKSHLNLLKRCGKNLSSINDQNVRQVINSLTNKNGEPLSDNYKISILNSIRMYVHDVNKKASELGWKAKRNENVRRISQNSEKILRVIRYVYRFDVINLPTIATTAHLDAMIATLLLTSTTISIRDIYHMKISAYQDLKTSANILVNGHHVLKLAALFALAEAHIDAFLQYRAIHFSSVAYQQKPNFQFNIISCSVDVINKKIREMFASINHGTAADAHISLGLQALKFPYRDIILEYISF